MEIVYAQMILQEFFFFSYERPKILKDDYHTFETSERIKTHFWSIFTLQRSLFETETII